MVEFDRYAWPQVAVEQYNRRVAQAMERAQRAFGVRSDEAFSRALADRVGGSPAGSTYRRWLQEQQVVPGWALVAAAELTGLSLDALVGQGDDTQHSEPAVLGRLDELQRQVEALQRQVADLQVEALDRASAQPTTQDEVNDRAGRRAHGA